MARRSWLGAVIFPAFISSSPWTSPSQLTGNKLKVVSCWLVALLGLLCGLCGAESDFSILEEAQVLAVQMRKLSAQELGVFTMQVTKHSSLCRSLLYLGVWGYICLCFSCVYSQAVCTWREVQRYGSHYNNALIVHESFLVIMT